MPAFTVRLCCLSRSRCIASKQILTLGGRTHMMRITAPAIVAYKVI
jgi:hypothetical protein